MNSCFNILHLNLNPQDYRVIMLRLTGGQFGSHYLFAGVTEFRWHVGTFVSPKLLKGILDPLDHM